MTSIADSSVTIQTSSRLVPSTPTWFGEVALLVHHLRQQGILSTISERVRFARRRFGRYEVLDFVAVLLGYAISGERPLETFYERLHPFAGAFMALFGRDRLPARSTLSRFLTALPPEPIEALRALFLAVLLARPLAQGRPLGGLWDRAGTHWLVFDVDGTREAARQRAVPQAADRPAVQRRLRPLCARGYLGRKRWEVVRSRTTILHAHTYQWLGTFGHPGNGEYRAELRRAVGAIERYLQASQLPPARAVLRLDGHLALAGDESGNVHFLEVVGLSAVAPHEEPERAVLARKRRGWWPFGRRYGGARRAPDISKIRSVGMA